MSSIRRLFFCTVLVMLMVGILPATAQASASWTILHYAAFDNDLEQYIFSDIMQMRAAGSSPQVNLLMQLDRTEGYETRFGNWTDTRRFYLTQQDIPTFTFEQKMEALAQLDVETGGDYDQVIELLQSLPAEGVEELFRRYRLNVVFDQEPLEILGELDMSDEQTLADFITWGISNYPADKYMLVISSHGLGWGGIGPDYDSGETKLDLNAMQRGIRAGLDAVGVDKIDIIGFDACLMAQYEVAVALKSVGRYLLAAEEVIPGFGWEYTTPYKSLNANPNMGAEEFGRTIIDSYMAFYGGEGNRPKVDLHLIDLSKIDDLTTALNIFEQVAGNELVSMLTALGVAWTTAQRFGVTAVNDPGILAFLDIRDFMGRLRFQRDVSSEVFIAASNVIFALDNAVTYSRATEYLPGANGLSIYYPINDLSYFVFPLAYGMEGTYPELIPTELAFRDTFLNNLHSTIATQLSPDALSVQIINIIAENPNAVSIHDTPVIVMEVQGQGIKSLMLLTLWQAPNGDRIIVSQDQIASQAVFDAGDGELYNVIQYGEGRFQYTWDVFTPALTDGKTIIPALIEPRSPRELVISGVLTRGINQLTAFLVYDVALARITSMYGQSDSGSPFEVSALPGDTFTPTWLSIDSTGEFIERLAPASLDLTLGFPRIDYLPAEDGDYRVLLRIEDLAGNVKISATDVVVQNAGLDANWRGFKNAILGVSFLYPFTWFAPELFITESGAPVLLMGDRDEPLYTIAITQFENTSLTDAKAQSIGRLQQNTTDLVLYDETVLTDFPYAPIAIEFQHTEGNTLIGGVRLFYENAETNSVYVVNLTVPADRLSDGVGVLARLAQSIFFFTPF